MCSLRESLIVRDALASGQRPPHPKPPPNGPARLPRPLVRHCTPGNRHAAIDKSGSVAGSESRGRVPSPTPLSQPRAVPTVRNAWQSRASKGVRSPSQETRGRRSFLAVDFLTGFLNADKGGKPPLAPACEAGAENGRIHDGGQRRNRRIGSPLCRVRLLPGKAQPATSLSRSAPSIERVRPTWGIHRAGPPCNSGAGRTGRRNQPHCHSSLSFAALARA